MLKRIFTYGALAGVIVGAPLFLMTTLNPGATPGPAGMALGYAMMLLAFSLVFVAVKRQRDVAGGGVIRFWPALGMGLAISAVASVIYVLAWEAALQVSGLDFGARYAEAMVAQKAESGASAEEIEAFRADMARFTAQYANPLYRLPISFAEIFPVGLLVSLVTAGLLRNDRLLPAK